MTHINPGTDTTINPVVIDDSFRSKKKIPPTITAWAIKAPDGSYHIDPKSSKEQVEKLVVVRNCLESPSTYRCVRVNIQEVSE